MLPTATAVFLVTNLLALGLVEVTPSLMIVWLPLSTASISLFAGVVVVRIGEGSENDPSDGGGRLPVSTTQGLMQLALVGFVAGVGECVGLVMLVVPGLVLITAWSVIGPVIALERPRRLQALSRSRELVRGNGWRVFAVITVLSLIVGVPGLAISVPFAYGGAIVRVAVRAIVGVLTEPLAGIASAILYFSLRDARRGVIRG